MSARTERPATARGWLTRAIVSLPDELARRDSIQERFVFFEAPRYTGDGGAAHLEQLLSLAWCIDARGWCEQGLIYNIARETELLERSDGEGDTRLLEMGWGPGKAVHYAKRAEIDLFVTPRIAQRLLDAIALTERVAA